MIKRIKAIAETGLVYAKDGYDRERYTELREISLLMLSKLSNRPVETLEGFFLPPLDYPTPKVDVRGLVLNAKGEVLMVRERVDGKWTLPGGWADIGYSPAEGIVKEIGEETGLKATVVRLLAIYDKRCHPYPPQPFYVYKMGFLCKAISGTLESGFDMGGVDWFALDDLPPLSEDRILEKHIRQLYDLAMGPEKGVYFD